MRRYLKDDTIRKIIDSVLIFLLVSIWTSVMQLSLAFIGFNEGNFYDLMRQIFFRIQVSASIFVLPTFIFFINVIENGNIDKFIKISYFISFVVFLLNFNDSFISFDKYVDYVGSFMQPATGPLFALFLVWATFIFLHESYYILFVGKYKYKLTIFTSLIIAGFTGLFDGLNSLKLTNIPTAFESGMTFANVIFATVIIEIFVDIYENNKVLKETFYKFVPSYFLDILNRKDIVNIKIGDNVEKKMSVFFADIRSFTEISENMTPEENMKFVNDFYNMINPEIINSNGYIDKFIGDEVMALYPYKPDDAMRSSITLLKKINNKEHPKVEEKLGDIRLGIGLHYGKVILGTIGDNKRMDVTVISDTVNTASRLENLTKFFNTCLSKKL